MFQNIDSRFDLAQKFEKSFVGFNYLSSIFLDYHQNLVKKQLMPTKNMKFSVAKSVPKICYVTMEDNLDPPHYFKQILLYSTIHVFM